MRYCRCAQEQRLDGRCGRSHMFWVVVVIVMQAEIRRLDRRWLIDYESWRNLSQRCCIRKNLIKCLGDEMSLETLTGQDSILKSEHQFYFQVPGMIWLTPTSGGFWLCLGLRGKETKFN